MSSQTSSKITKLCSVLAASYICYKWYKYVNKPVIAVDLDEVLCQFVELICRYVNDNKLFGDKQYTVTDFNSYLFHEVWGGYKDETTTIVQDFLSSEYFTNINEMKQIPDAYNVLLSLKSKFKFVICTSRQLRTKDITIKWVNKFFPNIFDQIVFGNHFGLTGKKVSKPDLCKQLNARILIDDSSYYAKQSHSTLDYVVIFDWNGKYGWNKTEKSIAPNVSRLHNWNEIKQFLEKYHQEIKQ
eukprot:48523_1